MMKRLLSRLVSSGVTCGVSKPMMEDVEGRLMLAAGPRVQSIFADNRGMFTITMDRALKGNTINANSVEVFQVAKNGTETEKDVRVIYAKKQRQIVGIANLKANAVYKIRLLSGRIQGLDGSKLDGEFKGATKKSGNGEEGGDYVIKTKRISGNPIARYYTDDGVVDIELFKDKVQRTVENFEFYANRGTWDGTVFHRQVKASDPVPGQQGFTQGYDILQGGGYVITPDNGTGQIQPARDPVPLQAQLSNDRGTLAMARTSDPNSATTEWYFNVQSNPEFNPTPGNAGYTVFGKVTNRSSLKVMDKLANHERFSGSELPVKDVETVQANNNQLNPRRDLIKVARIALKMNVVSGKNKR